MTDAINHVPDTADQDVPDEDTTDEDATDDDMTEEDTTDDEATEEFVAPEFIDAPENLPGDHAEPTKVRPRRSPAARVESERSV